MVVIIPIRREDAPNARELLHWVARSTRNVSYYIVAHASKFVPPGSVRIASNIVGNLYNAAFKTPDGKKVLIVENDGSIEANFNIQFNGQWATQLYRQEQWVLTFGNNLCET